MTRLKDLYEYLDYLDNCSDGQFLKFVDAMEKRGYQFVTQYVFDYDYPHVTHCKDCIYFTPEKSGEHWNVCRFYDAPKTADGYCNDAERKEE